MFDWRLMSFEKLSSAELTKITNFLADLHQWEAENLACLNSIRGRHIYFGMARQTVGQPSLISSSLKDLYMGGSMTERALRLRIRELEAEGFVKSVSSETDTRSKYLVPTEVFYESIYHHAREVHRLLEKNFFLVSKEN